MLQGNCSSLNLVSKKLLLILFFILDFLFLSSSYLLCRPISLKSWLLHFFYTHYLGGLVQTRIPTIMMDKGKRERIAQICCYLTAMNGEEIIQRYWTKPTFWDWTETVCIIWRYWTKVSCPLLNIFNVFHTVTFIVHDDDRQTNGGKGVQTGSLKQF